MKIAIFCDSFFPTTDGVTISIKNSAKLLSKKNELYFFIPSGSKKLNFPGAKYYFLNSLRVGSYKDYKARIPKFIGVYLKLKKIRPDIVHIHSLFGVGLEGLFASKILKIPVITTCHTIIPEVMEEINLLGLEKTKILSKIIWRYMKFFLNSSDIVITPSKSSKEELINRKITKKIISLSNGIDTYKFSLKKRKRKKDISLISVGRLVKSKHFDNTVRAFNYAIKRGARVRLMVVGDGPCIGEIKKYIKSENIGDKVNIKGFVSNDEIVKIYNESDIFLTSSTIETEGISTLESMSTGLPVIGVNARNTPRLIKDCGIVVSVNNPKEMGEAILKLSKNSKEREKLGLLARKKAKEYDIKERVKELYEIYRKLVMTKSFQS